MWSAFLDACVLVPSVKRDVLLEVAAQGVYRPIWSLEVLDETERAIHTLREKRGESKEVTTAYVTRLRSELDVAFPDALVTGWESLVEIIKVPDPDDRPVVAAAMTGRADMIVTENLKDFPRELLPGALFADPTDDFLMDSLDLHQERVLRAVANVAGRTGRFGPQRTPQEIAELTGCAGFADAIRMTCAGPTASQTE